MTSRHRLPLSAPYPPLNIAQSSNDRTGETRYRVRGARVTGSLVLTPENPGWDAAIPVPTGVHVQYGAGDRFMSHTRREPFIVNGITVSGGIVLDPAEFLARERPRLHLHRATGPYTSSPLPDRTNRYAVAILCALVEHWYAQPTRDELALAVARRTAAKRLHDLYERHITPTRQRVTELIDELAQHEQLAQELCALASEHQHLTATKEPTS